MSHTEFMEILNTISCLHSALRELYFGNKDAVPGLLDMAKNHLNAAYEGVPE